MSGDPFDLWLDEEDSMADRPCADCDPNAPHGHNAEEEMDVDDDEPTP
jgi:hypothetical protein